MFTSIATVKNEIGSKGFGFVCVIHNDVKISVFTREERLEEAGIKICDFKKDARVEIDFEPTSDGRYRTIRIHAKTEAKKARAASMDQFVNPHNVAKNAETDEILWRIETIAGLFVRYVVANSDNLFLKDLGGMRFKEAHMAIGVPPPVETQSRKLKKIPQAA